MTGLRVIASNVSSPTNFVADRVMTAATSWPRFCSPRATSTALYAPIPPVTPSAMRAMSNRQSQSSIFNLQFLDLAFFHFFLCKLDQLVGACSFWRAALQQLMRTCTCDDHELEPSGRFISLCHVLSLFV